MEKVDFEFGNNIIDKVLTELEKAEKYIKIVVFQIHNIDIINTLIKKVKRRVSVDLITLPYSSINKKDRDEVSKKLNELKSGGANIYLCDYNLGDTSHTKTVPGPWHNLHLKFIVTDKSAIVLSANLISNEDIDAIIINNNKKEIDNFNEKFKVIKEDYIENKIFNKIKKKTASDEVYKEIVTPPEHLSPEQKSILHYPYSLCPDFEKAEEKLYLFPLDCRGRDFVKKIIAGAEEFVYLSTERLTDKESFSFLQKSKLKGINMKILTKFQSQDYQQEIFQFAKNCLSVGIELRHNKSIHAKLIITDKLIALGSINLNQMNLGFIPKKDFWRSNTEAMIISMDKTVIEKAKESFLSIFNSSNEITEKLIKKEADNFAKICKEVLDTPITKEAVAYIAERYLSEESKSRSNYLRILKKANELRKTMGERRITNELLDKSEKELN